MQFPELTFKFIILLSSDIQGQGHSVGWKWKNKTKIFSAKTSFAIEAMFINNE